MEVYPRLTVLPIGQGSCNLVEVYDQPFNGNIPQGNLIYLAMVDCGTSHGMADPWSDPKYSHIAASLDYVERKMRERANYRNQQIPNPNPRYSFYLDSFDLTHQDADHWCLFKPLILHIVAPGGGEMIFKNGNTTSYIKKSKNAQRTLNLTYKKMKMKKRLRVP